MEILRAEHLTKIYGKGNTSVTAVNDLSLSVAQGEFVAVVAVPEAENRHCFIC